MNRAFVVLGMHRSGTSAITRTLNLLGLYIPPEQLLPTSPANPLGYWEHAGIVRAHETFFAELGFQQYYGMVGPAPDSIWRSDAVARLESSLLDILTRDFLPHRNWTVKDPRMCRVVPAWLHLLERLAVEPSFVLITRNPLEVAASLRAREDLPEELSHWLWLGHVLDSERLTRDRRRVIMTYDALLSDWSQAVHIIAERLRVELPVTSVTSPAVAGFLNAELRHHVRESRCSDEGSLPERLSAQAWQAIRSPEAASEAWLQSQLDAIGGEWRDSLSSPGGRSLCLLLDQFLARNFNCERKVHEAVAGRTEVERQLRSVLLSRSWRFTAPLRALL